MVLDEQGVQDGETMLFLDRRNVEKLGHIRVAMRIVIFIGIMNRAKVVFHPGGDPGQAMVFQNRQANGGGRKISLNRRKKAADIEMGADLRLISGSGCVRGENLESARAG